MKADSNKRRRFLTQCLATSGMLAVGPNLWGSVGGSPRSAAPGGGYRSLPFTPRSYGPLLEPDENNVRLPEGFTSRILARAGERPVDSSPYLWHTFPDGGATYATGDGGWIYVSNSEIPGGLGGVGALRFDNQGGVVDAYSILNGTTMNCAGGPTPWGTWLSCEEYEGGLVFECDPGGNALAIQRPAMGTFTHEAAAVDPIHQTVYMTEDVGDGGFYRFTPDMFGNLSGGLLEIAQLQWDPTGQIANVIWHEVPNPNPIPLIQTATRYQVPLSTPFNGGEGAWFGQGFVYFTTKGDNRIWALNTFAQTIEIVYDDDTHPNPILTGVDNVTVGPLGNVMVAEDGGDLQIVALSPTGATFPVMQLVGSEHDGSEITGPAFSPDGRRLYFSSQRANGNGITYEITGPFNDIIHRDGFEESKIF